MARKQQLTSARLANQKERRSREAAIVWRRDFRKSLEEFYADLGTLDGDIDVDTLHIALANALLNPNHISTRVTCEMIPNNALRPLLALALRVIQLKEMPYDAYLQTPEWEARAREAKTRYEGRCALDAAHPAEHAHHRTYERRGREYKNDLVPLCGPCHSMFHGK